MSLVIALAAMAVGLALIGAGALKLLAPSPTGGPPALRALAAMEIVIGVGTAALLFASEAAAAVLLWGFACWTAAQLVRGRAGAPCPCFGAHGEIGRGGLVRTLALALLASEVAAAPTGRPPLTGWLALSAGVLACGCAGLAALAFTLAGEVAGLRGRGSPLGALEIPEEGPPLAVRSAVIEHFELQAGELALAVFLSEGCAVCRRLEQAIAGFARRPGARLLVFDEERDALVWQAAQVPGSPYAVVMGQDGIVLAKGTFNTIAQLESVPATAQRRLAGDLVHA